MDSENRTALYLACLECNLKVVKFLLKRHADPTIARKIDRRPLGCAIRWGYTDLVSRC